MRKKNIVVKFSTYLNRLYDRVVGFLFAKKNVKVESEFAVRHNRLWTISLAKKKSERFSQISFDGFHQTKIKRYLTFVKYLGTYIRTKASRLIKLINSLSKQFINYVLRLKSLVVKKMIWSRGKLVRPIANAVVMGLALVVFMFGEVFNSSRLVNSQEIDSGYLTTVSDIIPNRNTALTTIPESRKQSEPFSYIVAEGDSLSSIGTKFRISVDALQYVNGLTSNSVLKVGQEIIIPPVSGLIHTVDDGDTLNSIAQKYEVPSQAIADFNYILDTSSLAVGTELVIPGAKVPTPVYIPPPAASIGPSAPTVDPNAGTGWCMWPTPATIITQYFAWYHNGVDIAVGNGKPMPPLYSCSGGVVTRAGWDPFGLGLHVKVDHGNGYETVYGHMSRVDVGYGQRVSKGEVIGLMGSTGRSTGPHVHFIVNYNGVAQDPLNYIR